MAAIGIAGKDLMARELRAASAKACDARAARRMLAIALVLEGKGRKTAAETGPASLKPGGSSDPEAASISLYRTGFSR